METEPKQVPDIYMANTSPSKSNTVYTPLKKYHPMQSVNYKQCDLRELWGDLISMGIFHVFSLCLY